MDRPSPVPPAAIGRFRIDAILGSGGMGAVYRGFDPTLQRTVAIKTVRPDIAGPELLERLLREAQACARLRHPNIVTVYEAGEIDGLVYIVMEFLEGNDLGAHLERGEMTLDEQFDVLTRVLDALEHTHAEGVIHRDIKPSNVHRQPDGSIKLVDFGLARIIEATPLTEVGSVMGTPHYASPEQLKGEPVDGRTDIYSTGALAYEIFSGRRPFHADHASMGAVIMRVISEPPAPMNLPPGGSFTEIERIVLRAMAKAPADRYQSAAEMRAALVTARAAFASAETRLGPPLSTFDTQLSASNAPTRAAVTVAPRTWWLGAIAASIGVVAAGLMWTRSPQTPAAGAETLTIAPAPIPAATPPSSPSSAMTAPATAPPASAPAVAPATAATVDNAPNRLSPVPAPVAMSAKVLFDNASSAATTGPGLRYRLTRRASDGTETDVDPETAVFHSGDRVRFTFDSNVDGFLYVVQQGSSSRWTVLFPSPRINNGLNAVRHTEQYQVPANDWFLFDAQPGREELFVFFSREPVAQLPGFDKPVTKPEIVVASVMDDLQQRVRSRDLVFEKDFDASPEDPRPVRATYVVNRADLAQAVSAHIALSHQP
ncbi:MAG: serine/threonine-protein kinase [Vicinamibacterales bacterium]